MHYAFVKLDKDWHVVRAEIKSVEEYDELIEKLKAHRDEHFPPQKEEQNKQP